ncbi:hypothetical protein IEQ34_011271 [Dendrobium chrysotoxum]|uniref:Uncharacterized protein n=1 Tax=Dendrobium chrysotoxum TaxID=161865 RepID=A0AAV7GY68_DENCH|nr:hypothetical protein IEQ34_011271 [Dendrobium chrysotoxum]
MFAESKMCLPVGRPRSWWGEGSAKRKRRRLRVMLVLATSVTGTFSRWFLKAPAAALASEVTTRWPMQ